MHTEYRIVFTREGLGQEETPPMIRLPREDIEDIADRYRVWSDEVWVESRTVTAWVREPSLNKGTADV